MKFDGVQASVLELMRSSMSCDCFVFLVCFDHDFFGSVFGSSMCCDLLLVVQAAMPSACGGAASASSIWTWLCLPGFQF